MPYITQERRDDFVDGLSRLRPKSVGELNFLVTALVHKYVISKLDILEAGGSRYEVLSDGLRALRDAASEYYRDILGPYEDKAVEKNGPISYLKDLIC